MASGDPRGPHQAGAQAQEGPWTAGEEEEQAIDGEGGARDAVGVAGST
ncbi:hypothetical protein QBA75_36120 [Streptomyces stelliscabiei]